MIFYTGGWIIQRFRLVKWIQTVFYISISGDCLEDCFKDNPDMTDDEWVSMVEEFREECEKYLVSEKHDNARTPGFFKLEWEG